MFIKNLRTKEIFYCGFDHSDTKTLRIQEVCNALSTMKGTKWVFDKKAFSHMIPLQETYDVGFALYLNKKEEIELKEFETAAHSLIRKNAKTGIRVGSIVPISKHLEMFSDLALSSEKIIQAILPIDTSFKLFNDNIIVPLGEIEKHGVAIDPIIFKEHFGEILNDEISQKNLVYTQYNVYTSTGRPSNSFGGINYAALNKKDGCRKAFISRFGQNGKLILIDYSAFHPRIIAFLTNYNLPVNVDFYEYLAKLYFNKATVDENDISDAKQITFQQLFGGVQEKYKHIKYLSHLKEFIDNNWKKFCDNGYVNTPIFNRKITEKHIKLPKPATVFNYLLQAIEGEISIPVLGKINKILSGKKSQAVLYTYDSILFDYCLDDGDILKKIYNEMSLGDTFPMKVYIGDNYQDIELIS